MLAYARRRRRTYADCGAADFVLWIIKTGGRAEGETGRRLTTQILSPRPPISPSAFHSAIRIPQSEIPMMNRLTNPTEIEDARRRIAELLDAGGEWFLREGRDGAAVELRRGGRERTRLNSRH